MKFCKVRNVKNPSRANSTDAGVDFFIPNLHVGDFDISDIQSKGSYLVRDGDTIDAKFTETSFPIKGIEVRPNGRILIPSGIHVRLEPGTALILMNKSGVAAKLGLIVGSCVVDESYMGEIHISLINTTDKPVIVECGQKIVQGLILDVGNSLPTEFVDTDELYEGFKSDRGAGAFGHTGDF